MALSGDLKARYTSEMDVDWRNAFILSHPSAGTLRVIDYTKQFTGLDNEGTSRTFYPVPTQVQMPSRDSSGRSEMGLVWDGLDPRVKTFLDAAIQDGTQPIKCLHTVFILTSTTPQVSPFTEFRLTGISVTEENITATASRGDIINKAFPSVVYRLDKFPGLRRR